MTASRNVFHIVRMKSHTFAIVPFPEAELYHNYLDRTMRKVVTQKGDVAVCASKETPA